MRGAWIMACLLLAGCSGGGGGSGQEDAFDDVEVEVDETTGAIRGVVVDQSIAPIPGVTVLLEGSETEATTDEQGRFVFSRLEPGFYMLRASKPLYESTTIQAEVEAGNPEPAVVRVQLTKLYSGEPFVLPFQTEGYFTCSQAGGIVWGYTSSPCHSFTSPVGGLYRVDLCEEASVCLPQNRDFHADVGAGWQTLVFEMTWEPSAQGTSERMGLTVSTYKPERSATHMFASVAANNPMRFQLDLGEAHETSQQGGGDSDRVPEEGLEQMSFFASVRQPSDCIVVCPPGIAYEQSFYVYLHQFYYLPAPEGWSIVNGDSPPY